MLRACLPTNHTVHALTVVLQGKAICMYSLTTGDVCTQNNTFSPLACSYVLPRNTSLEPQKMTVRPYRSAHARLLDIVVDYIYVWDFRCGPIAASVCIYRYEACHEKQNGTQTVTN